jgi:cupin superfamily protein
MACLPTRLPDGGWSRFVDEFWEARPRVFRSLVPSPPALSRILFQAATAAASRTNPHAVAPPWRFVSSRTLDRRAPRPLPQSTDRNFKGYLARAAAETHSRDVTFILNESQQFSPPLFTCSLDFLSDLCAHAGTPLETDAVVFATRSRISALGIHRDAYSNFLIVAEGAKSFYLWPRNAVPGNPKEVPVAQLETLRASAERVDLEAGDALYMPSDYFHCAIQDGFSVHLSLVVAAGDQNAMEKFLWGELEPFLRRCFNGAGGKNMVLKPDEMMLGGLPDCVALPFRNGLAESRKAEDTVRAALIRTQSADGFPVAPAERRRVAMKPAAWVAGKRSNLYVMNDGEEILVGAYGQVYRCPAHPLLLKMLETLRNGEPVQVRELLRRFSGTGRIGDEEVSIGADWILLVLQNLYAARWLNVVRPPRVKKRTDRLVSSRA